LPILRLPLDRMRPKYSLGVQGVFSLNLSAVLTRQLNGLAVKQAGTLFTVLLAGFQMLLHRYSGQDDVVVGSPVPGRSDPEWDHVVGDFVNVIALRAGFHNDPAVSDVLRRVRNTALRGMANQDYPFPKLVERLQSSRGTGEHPFFQAVFIFQNARQSKMLGALWSIEARGETAAVRWGDIELRAFHTQQRVASDRIGLVLQSIELDDQVRCDFSYDAGLFDVATIEGMAESFRTLLEGMVVDAEGYRRRRRHLRRRSSRGG
jgi:non-ribosomal peptide synthetase component F